MYPEKNSKAITFYDIYFGQGWRTFNGGNYQIQYPANKKIYDISINVCKSTEKSLTSQLTFTCSKLAIETLKQVVKNVQKLTITTLKRRQWRHSGDFIVNFEHISLFFWCFYCYFWTCSCRLGCFCLCNFCWWKLFPGMMGKILVAKSQNDKISLGSKLNNLFFSIKNKITIVALKFQFWKTYLVLYVIFKVKF